jgi:hypothetical protein
MAANIEGGFNMRMMVTAMSVALLAIVGSASMAFAQAEKSPTTALGIWTRAQLDAAKKRWAESEVRFADCAAKLKEKQKTKRMSPHKQADFLEVCMAKP